MFLPRTSEKTQLTPLASKIDPSIQHSMPTQALPVYHSVLGLGLGVGGIFSLLCTPALAGFAATNTQKSASEATPATTESISRLFYGPLPELSYELPNEISESKTELVLQPVPLLPASAHAIRPTANLNKNDSQYDDYLYDDHRVAVEDNHPPQFSLSCGLHSCIEGTVARNKEKVTPDESAAALVRLLSYPAASHVGQAEIPTLDLGSATTPQNAANLPASNRNGITAGSTARSTAVAQVPDFVDALPGSKLPQIRSTAGGQPDDELGDLRLQLQRSRQNEDLGILRLLQTAQAPPPPPKEPTAFLSGRLGFFDTDNALRSTDRLENQIYQAGLSAYFFPKLSENTSLYAIAETSLGRYEESEFTLPRPLPNNPELRTKPIYPNYNQIELQLGLRQRLAARTYAQIGWHNQRIYSPGYRDKLLGINYIEAQVNHRSILNSRTWLDSFYQAQLGFAQSERDARDGRDAASRLRQTLTLSLNYAATQELRTSLLYQLDFEDYTQTVRNDFYQQVLGVISYNLTPESRLSLFAGTRFGRSSEPNINLDDTFYGAGLNVVVPFF